MEKGYIKDLNDLQIKLASASVGINYLVAKIAGSKSSKEIQIFGFYSKYISRQMELLSIDCKDRYYTTNEAAISAWSLLKKAFVVNVLIVVSQLLDNYKYEPNSSIKNKKLEAIQYVILNCENIPEKHVSHLLAIRDSISQSKYCHFLGKIKYLIDLKESKYEHRHNAIVNLFDGLNIMRNHYAHFSTIIQNEEEIRRIKEYMPFLIIDGDTVDVYPEDILTIISSIFDFLDYIQ